MLARLAQGYFNLVSEVWTVLTGSPLTPASAERVRTTIRVARLASQYLDEMLRCNEAHFAAAIVGCSVVECFLLLACIRDRDLVLQTRSWKTFATKQKKRGKLFAELLFWIDLGNLILIGNELGWFAPNSVPTVEFFASFAGSEEFLAEFPELRISPLDAVSHIHQFRNYLHPGKCVRNLVSLDERTARLNAGLVYVSLMGVLDFYQSDPVEFLDLEASPALCAQLPLLEVETHLG